jgi:hypothetical protein
MSIVDLQRVSTVGSPIVTRSDSILVSDTRLAVPLP